MVACHRLNGSTCDRQGFDSPWRYIFFLLLSNPLAAPIFGSLGRHQDMQASHQPGCNELCNDSDFASRNQADQGTPDAWFSGTGRGNSYNSRCEQMSLSRCTKQTSRKLSRSQCPSVTDAQSKRAGVPRPLQTLRSMRVGLGKR
jgi:hypothetical protein